MSQIPSFPNRDAFFDAKGKPTADLQKFMDTVQVAWPIVKWFQQIQRGTNDANALAMLGATADETGRGGSIQRVQTEALLALLQPSDRSALIAELLGLALERSERPPSDDARILAATESVNPRPILDELLALTQASGRAEQDALLAAAINENARPDFRAFVLEDTHAKRVNGNDYPAGAFEIGQLFWETDRTTLYAVVSVADVKTWVYVSGAFACLQVNLPADLSIANPSPDYNFRAFVTNFQHRLRWKLDGTGWEFADGDAGGGFIQGFEQVPANPSAWVACAGQLAGSVSYLKADGTLGTNTNVLPAAAGGYLKFAAAYNAARLSGKTDFANTGGSVSTASASVNAGAGAPATFLTAATFNEGNHQHNLTTAELAGVDLIPYFRV